MCHSHHTKLIAVAKKATCCNILESDKERVTGKGASSIESRRIHKEPSHFLPVQQRESSKAEESAELKAKKMSRGKKERKQKRAVQYLREGGRERVGM